MIRPILRYGAEVLHQPAAHSDGDSVVLFRQSDVVVTGDIVDLTRFPVVDPARSTTFMVVIAFNDTFGMALMFFLSGLFVRRSLFRTFPG